MKLILASLVLLVLLACGLENQNQTTRIISQNDSSIFGGAPVAGNKWSGVVALTANIGGYEQVFCSGVLLTRTLVLTAAHCMNIKQLQPYEKFVKVYMGNGSYEENVEAQFAIKSYGIHPLFKSKLFPKGNFDFAYILLDQAIPENIYVEIFPVVQMWELLDAYRVGNVVDVVGFGLTDEGNIGVKQEVQTTINRFKLTELFVGGDGKDSCEGDSGGPVYGRLSTGEMRVFAITSRGDECGTGGLYGQAYLVIPWIYKKTGINLTFSREPAIN